jgi:arginase
VAVKIVRQPNRLALLGAPTSAAATSAGSEKAPAAWRSAGLVVKLQSIGYEVADFGDDPPQLYHPDEENPRARNVPRVLAALDALKPRVEQAVKSGALPLILSGDASVALATIAALRRYFRHVSLLYMDRDAGLHTPATTQTGSVDGMVASHATGRGAAELVRFWGEPPLVREPELAIFGTERMDPAEEEWLRHSPIHRYLADDIHAKGAAASAEAAVQQIHGRGSEFLLHLDVDVISDFQATNAPGSGGLTLDEVREALATFASHGHLAAFEVAGYNPDRDIGGAGARLLVDLLAQVLSRRLSARSTLESSEPVAVAANAASSVPADQAAQAAGPEKHEQSGLAASPVVPGGAWSPDDLSDVAAESSEAVAAEQESHHDEVSKPSGEAPDSHS